MSKLMPHQILQIGILANGQKTRDNKKATFHSGGQRQTNASVARRRLNDGVARLEQTLALCVFHHPEPDAVLYRTTGVEVLALDICNKKISFVLEEI